MPTPSKGWVSYKTKFHISQSESSVGEELARSSWRQGNAEGPCWCDHQKETDRSNWTEGSYQEGVSAWHLETSVVPSKWIENQINLTVCYFHVWTNKRSKYMQALWTCYLTFSIDTDPASRCSRQLIKRGKRTVKHFCQTLLPLGKSVTHFENMQNKEMWSLATERHVDTIASLLHCCELGWSWPAQKAFLASWSGMQGSTRWLPLMSKYLRWWHS